MARCPPANQHTAKTKTTQGNHYRASKWVIVIGNDVVGGSEKQIPAQSNQRPVRCPAITLTSNSRQDEKRATDNAKNQTHDPEFGFPCERGNRRDGNRDLKHGYATREHFVLVKV